LRKTALYSSASRFNRSPQVVFFFRNCTNALATFRQPGLIDCEIQMAEERVFANWLIRETMLILAKGTL